jgi:hypothetical protein
MPLYVDRLTVDDERVILRLLALGRLSEAEWRRHEGVLLNEWIDLTKRSTLVPLLERLSRP